MARPQAETRQRRGGKQSGATAVEFALLFPVLFSVIYAGIVYGFIFFVQQRINFAAQEGMRAAVAQDPANSDFQASVTTAATQAVLLTLGGVGASGLPDHFSGPAIMYTASNPPGTMQVQITVTYTTTGVFPTVTFPIIGPIPGLPPVLTGLAVGRVS